MLREGKPSPHKRKKAVVYGDLSPPCMQLSETVSLTQLTLQQLKESLPGASAVKKVVHELLAAPNMTSERHRRQTSSAPTGTLQVQGRGALGLGCWRSNLSSMVSSIYLRRLLWDHKALISIIAQSTRCSYQGSGTPLKGRMA